MTLRPKRRYTLKIDPKLLAALRAIKERDGIAESEQIRRGIRLWLDAKGTLKAERSPKTVKHSGTKNRRRASLRGVSR